MPRYRLTFEFDARDDALADAMRKRAGLALSSDAPFGVSLLREGTRPWLSVAPVYELAPPARRSFKPAGARG